MSRPPLVVPHPSVRTLVCPQTLWRNVAPALFQADDHMTDDLKERGNVFEAACIPRAEEIRASLEEAMHVKPELEASKARISHLVSLSLVLFLSRPSCICIDRYRLSPLAPYQYRLQTTAKFGVYT